MPCCSDGHSGAYTTRNITSKNAGEQLQTKTNPFSLLQCEGNNDITLAKLGRFRWVSTSIVRFDLVTNWPPDLCFKLVINPGLKTYDGIKSLVQAKNIGNVQYKTSSLTMYVNEVHSQKALEITGGRWQSKMCIKEATPSCSNECPIDGIQHLRFSHPVIPSRVLAALTLDKGAGLHDWILPCSGEQEEQQTNATVPDTPVSCVAIKPRNLRSDGTRHELKLPKFSRVSDLGGRTQRESVGYITGVLPFEFRFKQKTIPSQSWRETRPAFRRYTLYLRHGLQILVAAAKKKQVRLLICRGIGKRYSQTV